MDTTPRWLWAFLLGIGTVTVPFATRLMAYPQGPPAQPSQRATLKPATAKARNIPLEAYDFQTEEQLLALANQARRQAGAPPLKIDEGLSQAARIHAQAMREARRLSHQFDGEPALPQRLAAKMSRSITTQSTDTNISCFLPRIARICSIRPTTWSAWA